MLTRIEFLAVCSVVFLFVSIGVRIWIDIFQVLGA